MEDNLSLEDQVRLHGELEIIEKDEYVYLTYTGKTTFMASAPLDYFTGKFTKAKWIKDNLQDILNAETKAQSGLEVLR